MPHRRALRALWHHLAIVALLLASLSSALVLYFNGERSDADSRIITDIQADRLKSCMATYEGIRQVFKPFFRTKSQRTDDEQRQIDKFNQRVDFLKSRCTVQTGVKPQGRQP